MKAPSRKMSDRLDMIEAMVKDIHGVIFGSASNPDRKGYAERLRDVEDYLSRINRLIWLGVGAVVVSLVTLAFSFVK